MPRIVIALGALVVSLAGCVAEAQDEADPWPRTEAGCSAAGGEWARGGLYPEPLCFLPTPDAGAACAKADDCTGVCLSETRTGAPVQPIFGCYGFLDEAGEEVMICVD